MLQAPTSKIKSKGRCFAMRGLYGRAVSPWAAGAPRPHVGVCPVRRFRAVGKVRVESGNSLETFALAKVSRSLPIVKLAISIPKWQGVPRQGWSGALP